MARSVRPAREEPAYRKLQSSEKLQRLMRWTYGFTQLAPRLGLKTVWLTSGAPVEVTLAMGLVPQYPENYTALCGARQVGVTLCQSAEAEGYPPDLCAYARAHLGSLFTPEKAPLGGLARPDLLVASNNICGTIVKWFEHVASRLGVPLFVLDTPFPDGERSAHLLGYAGKQVEELIGFLERHTGRRFKEQRLRRVAARSAQAVGLWNDCLDLCTARPSPLSSIDRFLAMAPVVALRGTRLAVRFYRALKREVVGRVERGLGAVREERHRLLWDNIAIWHDLTGLARRFAAAKASFPVDTYTSAWTGMLPENENPIRAVARVYSDIYLNKSLEERIDIMERMIRRFHLDGFVLHSNRSCKTYSLGQLLVQRELTRRTGKPGLLLEADMVDAREYDAARVGARIDAFLEVLG
jgi:benzoyl-CoA reductase/2-hydroxyglutaryl-CoA dehydratase subunit BcrC/BadD/HgdB